jgi:hypothetical protein
MGGVEELRVVDDAANASVFHLRDTISETEDSVVVRHDDNATFGRAGEVAHKLHDMRAGVLIEG